jgi:osmotically-inducible protein OsmY
MFVMADRDFDRNRDRFNERNRNIEDYGRAGRGDYNRVNYIPDNDENRDRRNRDYENTQFGTSGTFGYRGSSYSSDFGYNDDRRDTGLEPGSSGRGSERVSYRGRGPKDYRRSEDRIREDVCERLTDNDKVDASNIEVKVQGDEVVLEGTVHSKEEKRRAEDLAETVSGVHDVQNRLRIDLSDNT